MGTSKYNLRVSSVRGRQITRRENNISEELDCGKSKQKIKPTRMNFWRRLEWVIVPIIDGNDDDDDDDDDEDDDTIYNEWTLRHVSSLMEILIILSLFYHYFSWSAYFPTQRD